MDKIWLLNIASIAIIAGSDMNMLLQNTQKPIELFHDFPVSHIFYIVSESIAIAVIDASYFIALAHFILQYLSAVS